MTASNKEKGLKKLASMRSSSFYGEEDYSKEQAKEAFEEAKFVLGVIENHFKS